MKTYFHSSAKVIFTLLLICAACNEDDDSVSPQQSALLLAPIARAGYDTIMFQPASEYVLDGSASSDPDSKIASYKWKLLNGPAEVKITQHHFSEPKAYASGLSQPGDYDFELMVTDADNLAAKDTVTVTVLTPMDEPIPLPIGGPGCDDPKEYIFKDLAWNYSWIMEIDIFNFLSYLPANIRIQKILIKRDSSDEWQEVVYLGSTSGYTVHTWDYGNNILAIYPSQNTENDTPDVKIVYCE